MKILDRILSQSAYSHDVDVALSDIDIAEWLFTLPEAEYLRCCVPDHIAAGITTTDDGRRMSINVEMVGTGLVVQHYVANEATPTYCRMNSISDVFTIHGRTQVNVLWELIAEDAGNGRTRYTNRVTARPTETFMTFIAEHGGVAPDIAAADPAFLQHGDAPNAMMARKVIGRRQSVAAATHHDDVVAGCWRCISPGWPPVSMSRHRVPRQARDRITLHPLRSPK